MISNLFNLAINLIGGDEIYYKEFTGNTTNEVGQLIPNYLDPVKITGSFQNIETSMYEQLGLDISKNYRILYTNIDITGMGVDTSSDRVVFDGIEWQALDKIDWLTYNGWCGVLFSGLDYA